MNVENGNHSFIIRIWENIDGRGPRPQGAWRGSIDYVGSGKRLYFNDLDSIVGFIREQVLPDESQPVARWESIVERFKVGHRMRVFWRRAVRRWVKLFQRKNGDLIHPQDN